MNVLIDRGLNTEKKLCLSSTEPRGFTNKGQELSSSQGTQKGHEEKTKCQMPPEELFNFI